jgi:hypothetical protein
MSKGRSKDKNGFMIVIDGALIGAAIAVAAGIIWKVAFGDVPWFALISWWALIGIGVHIVTGPDRNAVQFRDPISAVVMVFVATWLIGFLPSDKPFYDKLGAFKTIPMGLRTMVIQIHHSPGIPATFWTEAEAEIANEKSEKTPATTIAMPRQVTSPTNPLTGLPAIASSDIRQRMRDLADPRPAPPSDLQTRAFYESWIVILLFALGAGLAPIVERELRPVDYPNSQTFRNDLKITGFMVGMILLACGVARAFPSHDRTQESAAAHARPSRPE